MVYTGFVIAGGLTPMLGLTQAGPPSAGSPSDTSENNPEVFAADHALVAALTKGDKAAADKLFDPEFVWTNSAGDTIGRAHVLESLPKPLLGDESGAQLSEHTYGQVGAVQVASGKVHILRIWVKRPAGWRLLDYHEVAQRTGAAPPAGPGTNDCENPCKGVPYTPKDEAEKGILKSWGELETAVTNHDPKGWSPHFLDEFVLISSGGTDPVTKAGRLEQLSKPGLRPGPATTGGKPRGALYPFWRKCGDDRASKSLCRKAGAYQPSLGPSRWNVADGFQLSDNGSVSRSHCPSKPLVDRCYGSRSANRGIGAIDSSAAILFTDAPRAPQKTTM